MERQSKAVVIREGETLQIWHYGFLKYNIRWDFMKKHTEIDWKGSGESVEEILRHDRQLFIDLIQQLREEGYFSGSTP